MRVIQSLSKKLLGALLLTATTASFALPLSAEFLTPYSAKYDAFRGGSKVGHAEMSLELMGENKYKLSFSSKASLFFFSDKREEVSLFSKSDEQLIPYKYTFKQDNTFKDRALALEFNKEENTIFMSGDRSMEWQGELDHQLYRLEAQKALKAGKKEFELALVNYRGQKKQYAFKVEGEETLELPYGEVKTIKVQTIRQNKKRTTYTWFAPDLNYLLVRIQQFKDGDEQGDIRLSKFVTDSAVKSEHKS